VQVPGVDGTAPDYCHQCSSAAARDHGVVTGSVLPRRVKRIDAEAAIFGDSYHVHAKAWCRTRSVSPPVLPMMLL